MDFAAHLETLKRALSAARIPVDDVLAMAGVNRSSWTRWNQGSIPRTDRWAAVSAAAEKLLAERGESQRPAA